MKQLTTLLKWDVVLLHRNRLFVIAAAVAGMYIGIFYLLKPLGNLDAMLTVLIFNDPVVTGYIFAGVLLMFDKSQNTLQALEVLPLRFTNYLLSKIVVLSTLAVLVAVLMTISAKGLGVNYFHLIAATFLSSFIFSSVGFAVGAISKNFNMFLMYSIPFFILTGVPFLGLFDVGSLWWYAALPSTGGIGLLNVAVAGGTWQTTLLLYVHLLVFGFLCWKLCVRTITKKLL